MVRSGKSFLIFGAVMSVIAFVLLIIGAVSYYGTDGYTDPNDVKVGDGKGNFTITLEAETDYQVWVTSNRDIDVLVWYPDRSSRAPVDDYSLTERDEWRLVAEFTTLGAGEYFIVVEYESTGNEVNQGEIIVTPVIDTLDEDSWAAMGAMGSMVGCGGGACLGLPGLVLLIVGIWMYSTREKRARKHKEKKERQRAATKAYLASQGQTSTFEKSDDGAGPPGQGNDYQALYGSPPPR